MDISVMLNASLWRRESINGKTAESIRRGLDCTAYVLFYAIHRAVSRSKCNV